MCMYYQKISKQFVVIKSLIFIISLSIAISPEVYNIQINWVNLKMLLIIGEMSDWLLDIAQTSQNGLMCISIKQMYDIRLLTPQGEDKITTRKGSRYWSSPVPNWLWYRVLSSHAVFCYALRENTRPLLTRLMHVSR